MRRHNGAIPSQASGAPTRSRSTLEQHPLTLSSHVPRFPRPPKQLPAACRLPRIVPISSILFCPQPSPSDEPPLVKHPHHSPPERVPQRVCRTIFAPTRRHVPPTRPDSTAIPEPIKTEPCRRPARATACCPRARRAVCVPHSHRPPPTRLHTPQDPAHSWVWRPQPRRRRLGTPHADDTGGQRRRCRVSGCWGHGGPGRDIRHGGRQRREWGHRRRRGLAHGCKAAMEFDERLWHPVWARRGHGRVGKKKSRSRQGKNTEELPLFKRRHNCV